MIDPPRTKKEARKLRYGGWRTRPYDETQCAWRVWNRWCFTINYQCSRKPGRGPDGLYCKQHAKMIAREQ